MAVYIGLVTFAALLNRYKFVLVFSYIFVLYMGYLHTHIPVYAGLYFAFGVIVLILAIIALFREH